MTEKTLWKCISGCPYGDRSCVVMINTDGSGQPSRCIIDDAGGSKFSSGEQWEKYDKESIPVRKKDPIKAFILKELEELNAKFLDGGSVIKPKGD